MNKEKRKKFGTKEELDRMLELCKKAHEKRSAFLKTFRRNMLKSGGVETHSLPEPFSRRKIAPSCHPAY